MPTIKTYQRQVRAVEGFDIRVRHAQGRDVRDDKQIAPSYEFTRAASGNITVAEWRRRRGARSLPGYDVEILDAGGHPVHGRTLLSNLRETYRT